MMMMMYLLSGMRGSDKQCPQKTCSHNTVHAEWFENRFIAAVVRGRYVEKQGWRGYRSSRRSQAADKPRSAQMMSCLQAGACGERAWVYISVVAVFDVRGSRSDPRFVPFEIVESTPQNNPASFHFADPTCRGRRAFVPCSKRTRRSRTRR